MKIDICFKISCERNTAIPVDHGYLLYSALSRLSPGIHKNEGIKIHRIYGKTCGNYIYLNERSLLKIRCDINEAYNLSSIVGKTIRIKNGLITIRAPFYEELKASDCLYIPWTTFKFKKEDRNKTFNELLDNVLRNRISGDFSYKIISYENSIVNGIKLLGFNLLITGLNEEESLRLQNDGLGGRLSMGCGIPVVAHSRGKMVGQT